MSETISTKQLAAILGISVQRVNELGRKGKIKREADGGWDLVKVNRALRQNLDRHQALRSLGQVPKMADGGAEGDTSGDSLAEAQRRHEWLKVKKEDLELRRRSGELLERGDVETAWGSIITSAQTRFLLVADKLAPRVAGISDVHECRQIIDREIREVLSALSIYQPNAA